MNEKLQLSEENLKQLRIERELLKKANVEFCHLWWTQVYQFRAKRDPEKRRLGTETELNFLESLGEIIKGETEYHEERRKTIDEMKKLLEPLYTTLERGVLPPDAQWIIDKFLVHSKMDCLTYGLDLLLNDRRIFELQKAYPILLREVEKNYYSFMRDQQMAGKTYPEAKCLLSFIYIHAPNPSFFKDIAEEPLILYGDDLKTWEKIYLGSRSDMIRKLDYDLRRINPKYRKTFPALTCFRHFLRYPVMNYIPAIIEGLD